MSDICLPNVTNVAIATDATDVANDRMIVAYYRGSDLNRDHVADIICYKAMKYSEWENLVKKVTKERYPRFISFGYDCDEPGENACEIIANTTILTDPKLVSAMVSLLPNCIATYKDMFAILDEYSEDDIEYFGNKDDFENKNEESDIEESDGESDIESDSDSNDDSESDSDNNDDSDDDENPCSKQWCDSVDPKLQWHKKVAIKANIRQNDAKRKSKKK